MLKVVTRRVRFKTHGEAEMVNITREVEEAVAGSGVKEGVVTVFHPGSTGALTTIEYEPGLCRDFPAMLERIAPKGVSYAYDERWHDGNGHSHVRAALIGPSITIPFTGGRLMLGTWQQVVFMELDVRARSREVVLQIVGE